MKYLSLFSGIGGFEIALDGHECVGYSEINKYAIQIYEKHFPEHRNYGDITKINPDTLPDFEMVCGGFPCQAFSIAGKRGGFADTRGTLFFDIARILRIKRPRLVLLENVKGLLSHENGRTFKVIMSALDELGYNLQWQVLNSKNFGVPQNRERVFIIGHLRGTNRPKVFPVGGSNQENKESIKTTAMIYWKNSKEKWVKEYRTYSPVLKTQSDYVRQPLLDGVRIRRLTPTECERLQGFPDGWTGSVSDAQRYKTLGNAVTVNVAREIAKELFS